MTDVERLVKRLAERRDWWEIGRLGRFVGDQLTELPAEERRKLRGHIGRQQPRSDVGRGYFMAICDVLAAFDARDRK